MSAIAPTPTPSAVHARERDAFVEHVLGAVRGGFDVFALYLGVRLGLYDALAAGGPQTPAELARRTRTHERYVREWLEQQTVTGVLDVRPTPGRPEERRFSLSPARAEVLCDRESLDYLAPLTRLFAGAVYPIKSVLEAFRNGGGVPYGAYGSDLREGQGGMNRSAFLHQLGQEWLPKLSDVHARLLGDPPARVADLGCGVGWSSIGIARSYPKVQVDGFDLDAPSIDEAREIAAAEQLGRRVKFHVRDCGDPELAGRYDLVTAFEVLHDVAQPVAMLEAMRRLVAPGGAVLLADERVADSFGGPGGDVEWMMYGWSVLHCLPAGMADSPSAATGTVLRTPLLERYAAEAGFSRLEVLPIDHVFFRFYRLYP